MLDAVRVLVDTTLRSLFRAAPRDVLEAHGEAGEMVWLQRNSQVGHDVAMVTPPTELPA